MAAPKIMPLSWPASGEPSRESGVLIFVACCAVMATGGAVTLLTGHPVSMFLGAVLCGVSYVCCIHFRRKPVLDHINEQLLGRPACLEQWLDRPELAAVLCTALAREKNWPNDRFIPEDPVEIAFFEITGVDSTAELIEVGAELSRRTGQAIDWPALAAVSQTRPLVSIGLLEASVKRTE